MPPQSPRAHSDVRRSAEFGPVCPQIIPDLSNETEVLRFMTVGRMNYLKKLFEYLRRDQNEVVMFEFPSGIQIISGEKSIIQNSMLQWEFWIQCQEGVAIFMILTECH